MTLPLNGTSPSRAEFVCFSITSKALILYCRHTINFRKLRHTLSNPLYATFSQWTGGNVKSVARHLRTLQYGLRAPDEEVTGTLSANLHLDPAYATLVTVVVESLDKGASYVSYSVDDCAIFMAATELASNEEPAYDVRYLLRVLAAPTRL